MESFLELWTDFHEETFKAFIGPEKEELKINKNVGLFSFSVAFFLFLTFQQSQLQREVTKIFSQIS